jgi:hypothetical protein
MREMGAAELVVLSRLAPERSTNKGEEGPAPVRRGRGQRQAAQAVAFARERATGQLAALASVTIQFEAVEGGDMEGLPAVGNLRDASAVFFFHRGRWHTAGRAVFNLNPD